MNEEPFKIESVLIRTPDDEKTSPLMVAWNVELEPARLEVIRHHSAIAMVRKMENEKTQILILSDLTNSLQLDATLSEGEEQSLHFAEYQAHNITTLSASQDGWILKGRSWSLLWNGKSAKQRTLLSLKSQTQSQHSLSASTHWEDFRWWLQHPSTQNKVRLPMGAQKPRPLVGIFGAFWMLNGDIYYWSDGQVSVLTRLQYEPTRIESAADGWLIAETSDGIHALKPGQHRHHSSNLIDDWQHSVFTQRCWINDGGIDYTWDFSGQNCAAEQLQQTAESLISSHLGQGLLLIQGTDQEERNRIELWDLETDQLIGVCVGDTDWI